MAPEQLKQGLTSFSSDVFAFGIIAYELVSGIHPFHAETEYMIQERIVRYDPEPLEQLAPELAGVNTVIMRCLKKQISQRYSQMSDVLAPLQEAILPMRSAEARGLAAQGLAALNEGTADQAAQLLNRARCFDPQCSAVHDLRRKLENWRPKPEREPFAADESQNHSGPGNLLSPEKGIVHRDISPGNIILLEGKPEKAKLPPPPRSAQARIARWFLFYHPPRARAWIGRIGFYFFCLLFGCEVLLIAACLIFSNFSNFEVVVPLVVVLLILTPIVFLFRSLSIRLERCGKITISISPA
jgi:serine/threonine protein kinase